MCNSRQGLVSIYLFSSNFSTYVFGRTHSRSMPTLWCRLQTLTFSQVIWRQGITWPREKDENSMLGTAGLTQKLTWKDADFPANHPYPRLPLPLFCSSSGHRELLSGTHDLRLVLYTTTLFIHLGARLPFLRFSHCGVRKINLTVGHLS